MICLPNNNAVSAVPVTLRSDDSSQRCGDSLLGNEDLIFYHRLYVKICLNKMLDSSTLDQYKGVCGWEFFKTTTPGDFGIRLKVNHTL